MKKVLSFVLASTLILGSVSASFAAPASDGLTDLAGKDCELQAKALVDLGAVSGFPDGTFKPERDVTRAEMAAMILQALGLKETGASNTFKDSKNHWGKNWIGLAQDLGIITGYGDGTFRPDNNVSYSEAMTMLVKALGYNQDSLPGVWPGNYVTKAQRLGITDDISTMNGNANRSDVSIMLFNTLEEEIGTTNRDGNWKSDTTSMLDALGAKVDADYRVITDTDEAYINLYDYLGKSVKAYTVKKGNDSNKIIAIKDVQSTTLVGEVKSNSTFEADDTTYYYTEGDLNYIPFNNGVAGSATTGALTAMTGDVTLEVKLSGKTISEVYSASEWTGTNLKYDTDMLDGKDFDIYTLPTLKDGKTVDTSKFNLLGADSLEDIGKGSIVTVYVADGLVTKIEVSTATAEGTVTRISNDGADSEYTIGDGVYKLADGVSAPKINDTGVAYLDYAGNIAEWKVSDASVGNFAVLLAKQEAQSTIESDKVKLFTKDDREVTFEVKDNAEFVKASNAGIGGLIEYSVDKDGKISKATAISLTAFTGGKVSASGSLVGNVPVNENAVVFVKKGADKYSLATIGELQKDDPLDTTSGFGYYVPAGESKITAMIVAKADTTNANTVWAVLHQVDQALNSDGDTVNFLVGLADGKEYTAYTDELGYFGGFTVGGGLVELTVDANGVVTAKAPTVTSQAALTGKTVDKVEGNLIQINGMGWVAADAKAVVYAYNADKKVYEVKSLSYLKGKTTVNLYQVDKDSEQFDIIIVQ